MLNEQVDVSVELKAYFNLDSIRFANLHTTLK